MDKFNMLSCIFNASTGESVIIQCSSHQHRIIIFKELWREIETNGMRDRWQILKSSWEFISQNKGFIKIVVREDELRGTRADWLFWEGYLLGGV